MEIQDELDNQLEEIINPKMNEILLKSTDKISLKINETSNLIKKRITSKKIFFQKLSELKDIPSIKLINLEPNVNSLINHVLFLFANLEIISEFCFGNANDKKDMLKQLQEGNHHFIIYFIQLMQNMRNKSVINPDYIQMHQYLQYKWNNEYMNQNMKDIINAILIMLEKQINVANEKLQNKYPNIITNNFFVTLVRKKKCHKCKIVINHKEKSTFIIDLYLRKPEVKDKNQESLHSIFSNLLSGENETEKCELCGNLIIKTKSLKNLKKYLIINLDRKNDPQNLMNFIPSNPLIIYETKEDNENKEYKHQYELIACLARIKDPKENNNQNNGNNFRIYFKNFINGKFYKTLDGKCEEFKEKIQIEILDDKPQILIYKRI